ncbi:MAG: hypothetical protein HYS78_02020 [Parcubacteria group bacterium]|nr:hypothetical protein [Parcubacteria group bacterium]
MAEKIAKVVEKKVFWVITLTKIKNESIDHILILLFKRRVPVRVNGSKETELAGVMEPALFCAGIGIIGLARGGRHGLCLTVILLLV